MFGYYKKTTLALFLLVVTGIFLTLPIGVFAAHGNAERVSIPKNKTYTYSVSAVNETAQPRQALSNAKPAPVYGNRVRQVDRKEIFYNLPDNDVDRLPLRKTYTDTVGRGPGANCSGDLALAEVKYEVSGRDEDGIPNKYTAHAIYRGEENYTGVIYYAAGAAYTGMAAERGLGKPTGGSAYERFPSIETPIVKPADTPESGMPVDSIIPPVDMDTGHTDVTGKVIKNGMDEENTSILSAANSDSGGFSFSLMNSLRTLSPIGMATLATMIAAVSTLFILGICNKRKARKCS